MHFASRTLHIQRSEGHVITVNPLVGRLGDIYPRVKKLSKDTQSRHIQRWMVKHHLGYCRATHVAQTSRLSDHQLGSFPSYINEAIRAHGFAHNLVVNMDEMHVSFNMTSNISIEMIGTRSIWVRKNPSNSACTVVLAGAVDGTFLPR